MQVMCPTERICVKRIHIFYKITGAYANMCAMRVQFLIANNFGNNPGNLVGNAEYAGTLSGYCGHDTDKSRIE